MSATAIVDIVERAGTVHSQGIIDIAERAGTVHSQSIIDISTVAGATLSAMVAISTAAEAATNEPFGLLLAITKA